MYIRVRVAQLLDFMEVNDRTSGMFGVRVDWRRMRARVYKHPGERVWRVAIVLLNEACMSPQCKPITDERER